jgi:hypothetical protein
MRSLLRGVFVAAFLSIPTAALAQFGMGPGEKAPIWAVLSAGRGDLQVNCAICREVDQSSWAADLALGGWLNERTTLGGEMGMWRLGGDEATQRAMLFSLTSQMYPLAKTAAFVKLGVGFMGYRSSDGEHGLSARSLAVQAGFGYDIHVQRYVVVPQIGLVHGFNKGMYLDDTQVTTSSQVKLIRFGLGVGVGR